MQSIASLIQTIREDLEAHRGEWSRPGFQTLAVYRIGRWTTTIKTKAVRAPLYKLARAGHVFCRNFYGIELPFETIVGRRVIFEHQHGIIVHGNAQIGDGCILRQGCTLGVKNMDQSDAAPRLGRNVNVGCGAKLLGSIQIGGNVTIGANSVVIRDIKPNTVVAGIPAKEILSNN